METISENICFGGTQSVFRHGSTACGCDMTFAVYLPPAAQTKKVPAIWFLSGLTCTHENAMTKAAAQCWAAEAGVAIIFPDTSPRGDEIADDPSYDLGQGAGFYVNATQAPWARHFKMWDYISSELPDLIFSKLPIDPHQQGITGHSMGGHGALTLAMTYPEKYRSLSAFAPIANPTQSEWGRKQFSAYLGDNEDAWTAHDASILMRDKGFHSHVLIDQGDNDQFLDLLRPNALQEAMNSRGQDGQLRMLQGYDHSYFFIMSFMKDHVLHHAKHFDL